MFLSWRLQKKVQTFLEYYKIRDICLQFMVRTILLQLSNSHSKFSLEKYSKHLFKWKKTLFKWMSVHERLHDYTYIKLL